MAHVAFSADRLVQLKELLDTQYGLLFEYERELQKAEFESRVRIRLRMKDELIPQLREYEEEYATLLAQIADVEAIPDEEAKTIVDELLIATNRKEYLNAGSHDEIGDLLCEIKSMLQDPSERAAAKLKVALPILPPLVSYDLELNTGNFITDAWHKVRALFERFPAIRPR